MVIRTSIIGEEIHNNASLIEWAKSQKGKQVNGFTNHRWNGVTTYQYAAICEQIIANNLYENGTHHVFSNAMTKDHMLDCFNERFKLGLTINRVDAKEKCDRTMSTVKPLCAKLAIEPLEDQIMHL